ncbi:MAG TPA: MarR family transcriptional regulator [Polyangiaceae bacterium]|nr:MarR family transcriptional regulator [Polyangiaceae bacterium]
MKFVEARTGPPEDRLSLRIRQVCEAVGQFIEYWGFKAIHGRIWTFLALRSEPVSQIEIAEFFGVSRSLVSGAVAELIEHGLVRPVSDHRNAPYEAVIDFWPTISDVLRDREWMLVEAARLALDGAIEEMELSNPRSTARFNLERMRLLLRMAELAQALLRLLIGIRVPRKLEELGSWLKNSSKLIRSLRNLR